MNPKVTSGLEGARTLQLATALHEGARPVWRSALAVAAVAAGYFLGSILGLSLSFSSTHISAIWPPNAILLAAFLVTPRRRWWTYLLAVLPAHLLAQGLMGIPFGVVLINFVGNTGEALLGALAILHFTQEPRRFDRLPSVTLIMLFGGFLAPALASLVVAQLLALADVSMDPWLAWRLRVLTNALAVSTLVPPIVLAATKVRSQRPVFSLRRSGEAVALLATSLLVFGILAFALPKGEWEQSPLLLYVPLPLLLWATVRFGLTGVSLSVLTLGALSMWGAFHGYGPFSAQQPVENAVSLVLFLDFTCVPLLMLAALLEERKSAEEERRQAATLHGAVLASVHDQIAVVDRDGVILEENESWRAFGRARAGTNCLETLAAQRADGDDCSARTLAGLEVVLNGVQQRFQMEYVHDTPLPVRWFEMSVEGLKRPEGGAVVTHTDVTSRKKAELEAQERRQELAHLTRVSMLGEISGALAHELNQPLTAILSNAQAGQRLLKQEPVDLAEVSDILRDIAEDDRRAGEVIQRLRSMLRKEVVKAVPLELNELVLEVLGLMRSDLITRNISVTTELAPGLPPVHGDRVQLQQVLLNLILNACEAMSASTAGECRLTVVTAHDGEEGVQISVVDRGTGIPADEIERVFEPFFTTKEQGLGLGLPICRSIVEAHGGRLWASNNEAGGATFYLTLPLHEAKPG